MLSFFMAQPPIPLVAGRQAGPGRLVPLHGFRYGPVDKTVYGLSAGLCVGLDDFLLAFGHREIYAVIGLGHPLVCCFNMSF